MAADGSIVINVDLDDKNAQQELNRLSKRIKTLEDSISLSQKKKMPLLEQSNQLGAVLDEAKAKLYEMQQAPKGTFDTSLIAEQQERVRGLQAEWNRVQTSIERYDQKINDANTEIEWSKGKAGELAGQLGKAGYNAQKMEKATKKANKSMGVFATRLRGIVLSAFVFNILSSGMRAFTEWVGKVIKSNTEAQAAIARLKGALLTLAQPIVSVIVPAFTTLVNILTRVVSAIAQIFAMLTGASIESTKDAAKALNEQTEALEGTGAAAEEAAGSLAGFDEINQITTETSKGGGGAETITPDFDFESNLSEDRLKGILGLIEAIGAAFLAWRIGKALGLGLQQIIGLAVAIYSAIQFVKNMFDAWTNGVNWDNLLGMLLSAAGIAAGLYAAFGKVGAGIGLIVSGLAMLATGFHDAMENGWNLENLLTTISGIMLTGLGIGVLTGSWIPLLIAGIASALLAITTAFGEGENLLAGAEQLVQGFIDFFVGIFTGDFARAVQGAGEIFGGLKTIFNAVLDALTKAVSSFFDWLEEKSGGKLTFTVNLVREILTEGIAWVKTALGGLADVIQGIFEGVITFLSGVFTGDWKKAWDGIGKIGDGAIDLLSLAVESFVNFFIRALNAVIGALNKISVTIPDWVPVYGGRRFGINIQKISEFRVPRLAEGAVIPPNQEFLAVLGDQKSGTNIETPLSTMVDAFKQAWSEVGGNNSGTVTVVVNLDGREVARNQIKHINDMTRERGKPVILV